MELAIDDLKTRACEEIDRHRDELIALGMKIYQNPELGFKEFRTARLVAEKLRAMGLSPREGLAITGVKAAISGSASGPTVAILGELDSLACRDHPQADPQTGAAHACGHNAQIASMIGAGIGLLASDIMSNLAGNVVLFAVPAEEYVEIEYRQSLRNDGKIEFLTGKSELVRLGEFDDVDMVMIIHTASGLGGKKFGFGGTNNGSVSKFIRYSGRASHAGAAPHQGINALKAAMLGLAAIDANRETFRDEDCIRVHPIITRGGDVVSAVPADVRMETFVRGRTIEAILSANTKVDRALRAGAMAMGAQVEIVTLPGYLPMTQDAGLTEVFRRNAEQLVGKELVGGSGHTTSSTDVGDLSYLMPICHPRVAGAVGQAHGNSYWVVDYEDAVITPAKAMAMATIDLLANGAAEARRVLERFTPEMTKDSYISFLRSITTHETYDGAAG